MADRRRNVLAGVRTAVVVLAGLAVVGGAAVALAEPAGPVQPGVTAPLAHPAPTTAAPTPDDQPAELHPAQPPQDNSDSTPYYRHYSRPKKTPTPTPSPREVHIGPMAAPVPGVVPDAVVNGVNQTNQSFQNIIKPSTTPTPQPHK